MCSDAFRQALAIQIYARQAKNIEAERQACEIRLRAERRCGQLLAEMEKAKGGQPKNPSQHASTSPAPLADIGISYTQSSRWQQLAAIPEPAFERALKTERPTTSGIIAAHAPPRPTPPAANDPAPVPTPRQTPVDPRALWVWGRLQDFEREGVLAADPNQLFGTMLPHMRETVLRLAPHQRGTQARLPGLPLGHGG